MQLNQGLRLETYQRLSGEPVQNISMFERAWDECVELQVQSKEVWIGQVLIAIQSLDRCEIGVFAGSTTVGGMVVASDPWDSHVGPCMSVVTQYVLPEYRNSGVSRQFMRKALDIAKTSGARVLAFTHRKAPWRYETIYRSIR